MILLDSGTSKLNVADDGCPIIQKQHVEIRIRIQLIQWQSIIALCLNLQKLCPVVRTKLNCDNQNEQSKSLTGINFFGCLFYTVKTIPFTCLLSRTKLDASSRLLQFPETRPEDECLMVKKCIKKLCTHIISKFKVRSEFSDIFSIHQKYCFQVSFFKKTRVYAISIKFLILLRIIII